MQTSALNQERCDSLLHLVAHPRPSVPKEAMCGNLPSCLYPPRQPKTGIPPLSMSAGAPVGTGKGSPALAVIPGEACDLGSCSLPQL